MQISEIKDQPAELKNLLPKTRRTGQTKEFTARFHVTFNYSTNILKMLAMANETIELDNLWDDESKPLSSIAGVEFNREFEHFQLVFKRNNKTVLDFYAESLHTWKAKPTNGSMLEVSFVAFGLCSDRKSDTTHIHKILDDPSITLTIVETEASVQDDSREPDQDEIPEYDHAASDG